MTEIIFYHLERRPLERVLPTLLERCVERAWRTVVQTSSDDRVEALDHLLWTYAETSFLPHGQAREDDAPLQPVVLTTGADNPNDATVRFIVDRADPPDLSAYTRAVFIFDGNDTDALNDARRQWKAIKASGFQMSYMQQDEAGRWVKKA